MAKDGYQTNYIYLGKRLIAKSQDASTPVDTNSRQHRLPFGETIEAPKNDIGYTGHKFDMDLGLSYMQQRYYDPAIGRFYSNDPIGFRDVHSFNRYVYGNNNPYRFTDPDGRNPVAAAAQIGWGIGTVISYAITATTGASLGVHIYNATHNESSEGSTSSESSEDSSSGEGDKSAETPTGRRGNPMDVENGTNEATEIGGRAYSGHALDRMQGRGVPPSAVEDTIVNGEIGEGNTSDTNTHTSVENGIKVITNDTGRVVSVISKR